MTDVQEVNTAKIKGIMVRLNNAKTLAISSLLLMFSLTLTVYASTKLSSDKTTTPVTCSASSKVNTTEISGSGKIVNGGYANLVEPLLPAVVNVSTTGVEELSISPFEQLFGKGFNDELLNQFFGGRNTIKRKISALGSAFFIDDKGHVVTNYHVIRDANNITITTQDREEYKATVVGVDMKSDIAVLKIKAKKPLPYVEFGSSEKLRIGDPIISIGNPFGLGGTVTAGIVSAKSRRMGGQMDDFIQTDAAMNMGNSGGPIFNLEGKVVGISTMIVSPSGGSVGLGFAIASDTASQIISKLKEGKSIKRGMLGVVIQPVTKEIADAVGLDKALGAFVSDVSKDSPADKGGIKNGDVITKFDGKEIATHSDLPYIVGNTEVGKTVNVELLRYGKKVSVSVTIKDQNEVIKKSPQAKEGNKDDSINGLVVREVDEDVRQKFRIPKDINGLLVVKIKDESIFEEGSITAGDVIMQINSTQTMSASSLKEAISSVKSSKRKGAVLYIWRSGSLVIQGVSVK